jgi:hypothetical protein
MDSESEEIWKRSWTVFFRLSPRVTPEDYKNSAPRETVLITRFKPGTLLTKFSIGVESTK